MAHAVVIGVKQRFELRIEAAIALEVLAQDEGFEKPTGMGEVPFRRTGVVHGLNAVVFDLKWAAEPFRLLSYAPVAGTRTQGLD